MSPELQEYYQLYREWLIAGAPEMEPFSRHKGLRYNLKMVLGECPEYYKLLDEIQIDMVRNKVHLTRGFCNSLQEVMDEYRAGMCHMNERRVNWIDERTKE